jgi:PqqD family protein of HPr-rel-A system
MAHDDDRQNGTPPDHLCVAPVQSTPVLWALVEGADPAIHCWDDECLVHHALSNDTHRITAWAAELLEALDAAAPISSGALANRFGLDGHVVQAALESLARLELVTRA